MHIPRDLLTSFAGRYTAGQVGRVGREVSVRPFDDDEKAVHRYFFSLLLLRLLDLSLLENTVHSARS